MDPITQGAFGAVFTQLQGDRKNLAKASIIGCLAGMAPDLDVLIRSSSDPLLSLEYHRHFTHALLFIPFGALIVSLFLYPLLGRRLGVSFKQTLIWCFIGVATHALLDACTSYGTQLLWPFTSLRVAWDTIAVIDPLVTIPLLAMIVLAARKKSRRYTLMGIAWIILYFSLSTFQHQRALDEGEKFAESRGLKVVKIEAKPSFANILVWKIITTTSDTFYVDAVKVSWGEATFWEGVSTQKLSLERDFPWLDKDSQQAEDIERFRWFSKDYLAVDANNPNKIGDIRYSLLPHRIEPLWGIELSPTAGNTDHVEYYSERGDAPAAVKTLLGMIFK